MTSRRKLTLPEFTRSILFLPLAIPMALVHQALAFIFTGPYDTHDDKLTFKQALWCYAVAQGNAGKIHSLGGLSVEEASVRFFNHHSE